MVKRRTDRRRLVRKLNELRIEAWRRMHVPVCVQREWLPSVLLGHYAYYGLPSNWHRLDTFYDELCWISYRVLNRRNQRRLTWLRFYDLLERFPLPRSHVASPTGGRLLISIKLQEEPSAGKPHARIRKGNSRMASTRPSPRRSCSSTNDRCRPS